MCRAITCKKCGRPSWAGCGAHVEQVLGDVPRDQRCRCAEEARAAKGSSGEPRGIGDRLRRMFTR